jgi:hypothetical protein
VGEWFLFRFTRNVLSLSILDIRVDTRAITRIPEIHIPFILAIQADITPVILPIILKDHFFQDVLIPQDDLFRALAADFQDVDLMLPSIQTLMSLQKA